jgi:hypothetical protein
LGQDERAALKVDLLANNRRASKSQVAGFVSLEDIGCLVSADSTVIRHIARQCIIAVACASVVVSAQQVQELANKMTQEPFATATISDCLTPQSYASSNPR